MDVSDGLVPITRSGLGVEYRVIYGLVGSRYDGVRYQIINQRRLVQPQNFTIPKIEGMLPFGRLFAVWEEERIVGTCSNLVAHTFKSSWDPTTQIYIYPYYSLEAVNTDSVIKGWDRIIDMGSRAGKETGKFLPLKIGMYLALRQNHTVLA